MPLTIDADFFGGSVHVSHIPARGDVQLALRPNSSADVRQWFCFDVHDTGARSRTLVIRDAEAATYPEGFDDYEAMVSYDGRRWSRAETSYDGTELCIIYKPVAPVARYAYVAPYAMDRLERSLGKLADATGAKVAGAIRSSEDRPVYVASLGDEDAERTFWVIAAQHAGETPALWFMHGLMRLAEFLIWMSYAPHDTRIRCRVPLRHELAVPTEHGLRRCERGDLARRRSANGLFSEGESAPKRRAGITPFSPRP